MYPQVRDQTTPVRGKEDSRRFLMLGGSGSSLTPSVRQPVSVTTPTMNQEEDGSFDEEDLEQDRDEDTETESGNARDLHLQELMYQEEEGFRVCENVKNAIRVAVNEKLVKTLKFLPRSGMNYRVLDFVNGKGKMVAICNWLLMEMNYDYSWENKVRFWNTYHQWVRKQVTNHRSNVSTKLKERFLKSIRKGK